MKGFSDPRVAQALIVLALAACFPVAGLAAEESLPLSGGAYLVAQQAYDEFNNKRYAASIEKTREAIRLRPDVVSLRLLLANATAAQGKFLEAQNILDQAIRQLGPDRTLVSRRKEINRQVQAKVPTGEKNNVSAVGPDGDPILTGEVFKQAECAYKAYDARDFDSATRCARAAIALRPDILRLHILLIDALYTAEQYPEAYAANAVAIQKFGELDLLHMRRQFTGLRVGQQMSADAWVAKQNGDMPLAIKLSRAAADYAPERISYSQQSYSALLDMNDFSGLVQTSSKAIAHDETDIYAWTLRGYAQLVLGARAEAEKDFAQVEKITETDTSSIRTASVIMADAYMADGKPQKALALLEALQPVPDDIAIAIADRKYRAKKLLQARTETHQTASASMLALARPNVYCENDEQFGVSCSVSPADRGYKASRASYEASDRKEYPEALVLARQAVLLEPTDPRHRIGLVAILYEDDQKEEAVRQAKIAIDDDMLERMPPLNAAYFAQMAGDEQRSSTYFALAEQDGSLLGLAKADAAYNAMQMHQNEKAAVLLKKVIDADLSGEEDERLTAEQLENLRQAHADVTRYWGFDAMLSYRGAGLSQSAINAAPAASSSRDNSWQTSAEIYWRPFGSLGDRSFELYARASQNLASSGNSIVGSASQQLALGARGQPFAGINLILALERIIGIGSAIEDDWLARIAYSSGIGTERRIDVPSWWTVQFYTEAGHYIESGSTYATGNLRAGRSYRMDSISPALVLFPHAVIGADYSSQRLAGERSLAIGQGLGLTARYGFRDSKYDSYRSYIDATVQYRFSSEERGKGVFFYLNYSY